MQHLKLGIHNIGSAGVRWAERDRNHLSEFIWESLVKHWEISTINSIALKHLSDFMDGPFFEKKLYVYKLYNITYLKAALTSSSRLTCFCRELTATLRKSSQVKVPSQSQPASQTRFITSSSVGFWPKERRTYPTSLHWIVSSPWKNDKTQFSKLLISWSDGFTNFFNHWKQSNAKKLDTLFAPWVRIKLKMGW